MPEKLSIVIKYAIIELYLIVLTGAAMRKYRKKQLQEKMHLLFDAHACIETLIGESADNTELLEDCQNLAVEIGTEIEQEEGEGTVTVELLEEYCEKVYQVSANKFPISAMAFAQKSRQQLDEQLKRIEKSLQEDITEQQILLFFPYKASMWDSMETLWRNCMQDKNTTCLVVPLPYYIKDHENKKIKLCYEGEDLPEEVPILHYEEYLANICYADAAIYHNPYDHSNKITEVDERFFTSRMHEYAHTLVYIPYYVTLDKPTPSFMLAPGVKNADYVILQDEEIADAFKSWNPKEKDKFLPLGSPKIDKAVEMNQIPREELDIPEAWKERIRGKKVLFYNTHLINFYDEDRDFIEKLKSVFEIMKQHKDVVLWWRPHPLSEEMGYSTNEEKFREYEQLTDWYKREDIGIYDDTPKLHEAIAAADAYYGDMSSLVKIFQVLGKPVMIQDTGVL